jgi:hypothetical protein
LHEEKNLNLHLVVLGFELIEVALFKTYYLTLFQNLNVRDANIPSASQIPIMLIFPAGKLKTVVLVFR